MGSKIEQQQDAAYAKMLRRAWLVLQQLDGILGEDMADGMVVKELRIQGPNVTGGGYRVIAKGAVDGAPYVAFHNAETVQELLAGIQERMVNGSAKWREDLPYVPPSKRATGGGSPG